MEWRERPINENCNGHLAEPLLRQWPKGKQQLWSLRSLVQHTAVVVEAVSRQREHVGTCTSPFQDNSAYPAALGRLQHV